MTSNEDIASQLSELADLLEAQGASPYRVSAYRAAARTVREYPQSVTEMAQTGGEEALRCLRGIGSSLARSIHQIALHPPPPFKTACVTWSVLTLAPKLQTSDLLLL